MRRIPIYLVTAVCGLTMFAFAVMSIFAVDFQTTPGQLLPTVLAMLTQMPAPAAATQLARMGYVVPPAAQATAQAMWQQGMPADVILGTLAAAYTNPNAPVGGNNNGGASPSPIPPVVQVVASATPVTQANQIPAQASIVAPVIQPPTQEGVVPLPTASDAASVVENAPVVQDVVVPTVEILATPALVEAGNISGNVLFADSASGEGIMLTLTRPDGDTLDIPVGGDGMFSFAGMLPGDYTLEAHADGHISARAVFHLEAGQTITLSPATLMGGDTNDDEIIDLLDAALIASNFGGTGLVPQADLNHDGQVDVSDLTIVGSQYGMAGPADWH